MRQEAQMEWIRILVIIILLIIIGWIAWTLAEGFQEGYNQVQDDKLPFMTWERCERGYHTVLSETGKKACHKLGYFG